MKIFTNKQLFRLCKAVSLLERDGKRFLVDFGYGNAVEIAKSLGLMKHDE